MADGETFEEDGFQFAPTDRGYVVFVRGRELGEIVTVRERNGRYCFRLGFDRRRRPKTFRGRIAAAEMLRNVNDLMRAAENGNWSLEVLILRASEM